MVCSNSSLSQAACQGTCYGTPHCIWQLGTCLGFQMKHNAVGRLYKILRAKTNFLLQHVVQTTISKQVS